MLEIIKTRPARTPVCSTSGSAGIDFFVPDDFEEAMVAPGNSINIPSGIIARFDPGKVLIAFNKSGIAVRNGLQVGACVVDSDYDGEIHLHLMNVSDKHVFITPGAKLVQFILLDYNPVHAIIEVEKFAERETQRGKGAFGSTDD